MEMKRLQITRRQMMAGAARAAAGLAVTCSCAPLAEQEQAKAPAGFKLGVCDWTIGKTANPGSLEMAKRIGLDGVQVDFGRGDNSLPLFDEELQDNFLDEARRQKMQIASLAMGVLNNVPYKSDMRAERWVRQAINVAETMEVKVILLAFFGEGDLKEDEQGVNMVVQRLRRVAPDAEMAGVTLGIESWLSAEQHVDIIERVGSNAVKVYYDVGNSHKAGYDIYKEIRQLGPLICEFHAKDYDDLYGKGSIDFKEVRLAMDDIGYR
ncbi:MAG TPA: sugar phosphate isomerase/epimerase, partial [Phycisphaerales bacterium]|nr:sugar phosphate isomerase/epimerase [Phycisphaerales bacterium]